MPMERTVGVDVTTSADDGGQLSTGQVASQTLIAGLQSKCSSVMCLFCECHVVNEDVKAVDAGS
jgi:hypothetical protein